MEKRQNGVALVEFALVLPFLLLLSLMTAELGRAVYQYNSTAKVVRDAVRYLSTQTPGTHIAEARHLIVYGNLDLTRSINPLDPGLTGSNVPDPTWQTAGSSPLINTVTVRVTGYQFRPMIPNMFGTAFPALVFSDITATMRSPI